MTQLYLLDTKGLQDGGLEEKPALIDSDGAGGSVAGDAFERFVYQLDMLVDVLRCSHFDALDLLRAYYASSHIWEKSNKVCRCDHS